MENNYFNTNDVRITPYIPTLLSDNAIQSVENIVGYVFKNKYLISQAFIHSSVKEFADNEILEFIGDRALDLVVTKMLTEHYKNVLFSETEDEYATFTKTEAEFTDYKSHIVKSFSLASRIKHLGLHEYLITGKTDKDKTLKDQQSVQEDLFEAIVGAVTLDSNWNMEAVEKVVRNMHDIDGYLLDCDEDLPAILRYNELYRKISAILTSELPFMPDRAVNLVQELWQKKLILEPLYEFESSFAENGNPVWDCYCTISIDEDPEDYFGDHLRAVSKTEGKKLAALAALKKLYKKVSFIDNAFEDATPDILSLLYKELKIANAEHDKALRAQTDRMTEYAKLSASLTDEEREKFAKEICELNAESQRTLNNVTDIKNEINRIRIEMRKN